MKNIYLPIVLFFGIGAAQAQDQTSVAHTSAATVHIPTETDPGPTATIKGKVVTTDGNPGSFVNIVLKEINKTVVADEAGFYILKGVKPGTYTLLVSHTGLQTQEKKVELAAGDTKEFDFTLRETSLQLEEVIVEGRRSLNNKVVGIGKIPIAPMDLPQSITVVGQGLIRDQQAQRLSDIVRNVNGVYLSTTRGAVQESFSGRGYAFGSNNLFKNGMRVNSGAMPEVSSLERVEVLKGSAAILYGNVAPGGILNMVTKQPKFNFGGEVSFRTGSYDLYKPSFDVYGPINSNIAYRLVGTYESAGSFRDGVSSDRYYINPSLLFKLGKRSELLVQGDYLKHDFTPDFGIGSLGGNKIPDVDRSSFFGTPWQYTKTEQATANATYRYKISENWNLAVNGSYQQYKRDYFGVERIQAAADGKWARPLGRNNTDEKYYLAQVDLTGKFTTGKIGHILLAGVDADRYDIENLGYNTPTKAYDTINILDPKKYVPRTDMPVVTAIRTVKTPTNRVGAYVQDLISITPKLKLLAGVRYSYQRALAPDSTTFATGAKGKGKDKTDDAFSPRVGLVYKVTNNTAVFASYANNFSVNSGTDIYGEALKPSIIDQFEVGVKNDFLNGLLSVNVTAYRILNNNFAITAPFTKDGAVNSNSSLKQLTGQTTSDGIELDVTAHPTRGLDLTAGYSYNRMRYTKTDTTVGSYVEGERLVNTPAHTANATVFYTFSGNNLKGLKVGASFVYIGERNAGWNNQYKLNGYPGVSRLFAVDGYATLDLSAGYSWKKISVLAKVSNVTNTLNYIVHENYSVNPLPPRQFAATVAYKF
ncbi:TonB-dependent receptor [Paraflavitalea sp. CAU 1676]|uniref:TonB-dependent receptor n=1 Tax=Paraflavitalea sp. CAU 1676 TaxID=3032598 RepID=UPI0023DA4522|nr:TonB-dependent receptor [Paraflavitalea sp. CAU 1676]MDF2189915.1 TonB-dependent receptor [Paraflavitalea sp. CAU 1676]